MLPDRYRPSNVLSGFRTRIAGLRVKLGDGTVTSHDVDLEVDHPAVSIVLKGLLSRGRYEAMEAQAARNYPPPPVDLIELGGGIGFLSVLLNRHIPRDRDHLVIESNPELVTLLESNIERNKASCRVINATYAPGRNRAPSRSQETAVMSDRSRGEKSEPISLQGLKDRDSVEEFALAMDIEGAEYELIRQEPAALDGCRWILGEFHPGHGDSDPEDAFEWLQDKGFQAVHTEEDRTGNVVAVLTREVRQEEP